jgi:hypothetical protein
LTAQQWLEDLHFFAGQLTQQHKRPFHAAAAKLLIPQAENHWYELYQSARVLMCADALATLGVVSDPDRAACTFAGAGRPFTLDIAAAETLPAEFRQDVAPEMQLP